MKVIYKIKLDMARCGITPRIDAVQGDINTRYLELSLYDSGIAWKIPEAATVVIRFCKPDGTGGNYDALPNGDAAYTIAGNTITVALAPQVCTVPGIVKLSVCLINGDSELNTFAINIDVRKNPGLFVHSENYYKIAGSVADSGWEPDMYLGTDENGKVVVRQLDISKSLALRLAAEDFTHSDVSYFTYSESPAWDWLTSADNLDFELTCVVNGETSVYKKEDCNLVISSAPPWLFSPNIEADATPCLEFGNKDDSFYVSVSLATQDTGAYILESCALKMYRKRNFVQTVNGIAPDESGNVEVEGGIGSAEKKLILSMLRAIQYTEDVSAKYFELEALWLDHFTVAYSLTGVTASNNAVAVVEGGAYSSTLTADGGYTLTGAEVTITMGGVDITSTAYSGGVITIAEVTGDVVITVVAKEIPSYTITNNLTGVTTDNSATKVSEGGSYSATLTVEEGYVLSSLVITMGGVDITADVYGEGYILIPEVTGDVVITAVAEEPVLIETKSTGGTSVTAIDADGNTLYIGNYATCQMSKRTTQSDSTVNVVLTNPTEADIKASLYIGGIENGLGATIKLAKVTIQKAVCVASNVTIPAGGSVSYSGVVPAGYHMGVYCTHTSATVACYGNLDIYEPVNEYEFITATPASKWSQYSGDVVDETALVISEAVKYMTSEPFTEDTTLRVTVYNGGESSVNIASAAYQIMFAIYGDGTNAVGYNVKRLNINDYGPSLAVGCEAFDAEFTVPAGYYFATSIPASCIYVKKAS